jgi:hypothetical protein
MRPAQAQKMSLLSFANNQESRRNVLSFDALVAFRDLFLPCPKGQRLFGATYCCQLSADIRARLALHLCVLRKGI